MKLLKFNITLLFLSIISLSSFGQATDVIIGLSNPTGISISGNDIYISNFGQGKILKADLISSNPTPIDYLVGLDDPLFQIIHNNKLYFGEGSSDLKRTDLITTPNANTFFTTGSWNEVSGLAIDNNTLYFGLFGDPIIYKVDLSSTNPTPTVFADSIPSSGIAIRNNYLYACQMSQVGNSIVRFNLSQTKPNTEIYYPNVDTAMGLIFRGDELYIAEQGGNKISMINTASATPTKIDIATNLNGPFALALKGNELYFSQLYGNKVSKISLSPLSINDVNKSNNSTLYPNPANDKIYLDKVKNKTIFDIYNSQGQKIQSGKINNGEIDVADIPENNIYYLIIDNSQTIKFIK